MKENSNKISQAYFDCNATTPVLAVASEACLHTMKTLYGNPSSTHLVGLQAKNILETTRGLASQAVGSDPAEIIFTSGATEAIQTTVFSALQYMKNAKIEGRNKLLYCATEHKAVPMAMKYWVKMLDLPFEIVELPVDRNGQLRLDVFEKELPEAAFVAVMAVNNETGVIQDLGAIEKILLESKSKALWLVDCVQALGKTPLDLSRSRIDYATFSGHKLYAPKGIGILYVKKDAPFFPLIVGGGQEHGFRSGTENLPGVAALGAILKELSKTSVKSEFQSHAQLVKFRDQLVTELKHAFPKILFNTPFDFSVPTTINFSVPGFKSGELLDVFDSAGLRVSAGSACSSLSVKPSHVLDAMGLPEWRSASALRLSFGPCTSQSEVDLGCELIQRSAAVLKNNCLLESPSISSSADELKDGILHFVAGHANTWVLVDKQSRSCIIVDPTEPVMERIEHFVRCQKLDIPAVLDTHSHADHDSARILFQNLLSDRMQKSGTVFDSLGWPEALTTEVELEGGIRVPALSMNKSSDGEIVLARLKTPGHTSDSVSYLFGHAKSGKLLKSEVSFVFSGDMIFSGGLGRTNFAVSDPSHLFHSLKNLESRISPISVLCPAHDYDNSYATNLETEVRRNSLLFSALDRLVPMAVEAFVDQKRVVDRDLLEPSEAMGEVICGVVSNGNALDDQLVAIAPEEMKMILSKQSADTLVVDVREASEYLLAKNWKELGFSVPPRNAPLSRFASFIGDLLVSGKMKKKIVLICRSGRRSLKAAQSLRRLGFSGAYSLKGGISLI